MLDKKLQLKDGQTIAVVEPQMQLELAATAATPADADAVLVFAATKADLARQLGALQTAARQGKLVWVAYPKAKQLGTDLNRDSLREFANQHGLDPVRQVALDDTWSALRLKPLAQ